jgi:hypothetical protein
MKQKKIVFIFFVFALVNLVGALRAVEVAGVSGDDIHGEMLKSWEEALVYVDGQLPLHRDASSKSIVKFIQNVFTEYGKEGYEYLMKKAASEGYIDFVTSWVRSDLFPKDHSNDIVWYVLSRSATFGHKDVFEVVMKKISREEKKTFAKNIFFQAAWSGSRKMMISLLSFVPKGSRRLLIHDAFYPDRFINPAPLDWGKLSPDVQAVLSGYIVFV